MAEKDYKNVMHLGNPTNTIAVLNRYGFSFQKKFGQNFLIDENVVEKIVRDAGVTKDDFVLEIGPGIGTMTQILCENAREVVAVEIDDKLIPILTEDTLSWYDNVTVIHEDILKLDIVKLANERNGGKPIKVVANLPYYITTPIIMGLFESHVPLDSITIMVQKEVADRMQVGPGTKDYGALSLAVQYYAKPQILLNVPASCFMPRPNVDSAVIQLTRYEKPPVEVADRLTVRIRVLPALILLPLLLPHFLKHLPRSAALFQIHAHSRTFPRIFSPPPALLSGLPVLSQTLPLNLPVPPDLKPPPLPAVQM